MKQLDILNIKRKDENVNMHISTYSNHGGEIVNKKNDITEKDLNEILLNFKNERKTMMVGTIKEVNDLLMKESVLKYSEESVKEDHAHDACCQYDILLFHNTNNVYILFISQIFYL